MLGIYTLSCVIMCIYVYKRMDKIEKLINQEGNLIIIVLFCLIFTPIINTLLTIIVILETIKKKL